MIDEDRLEVDSRKGVTRYRYAAGGGPSIVYISELPILADGGDPTQGFVLVTILAPQQGAFVVRRGGYVTSDFVGARLRGLGILAVNRVVETIAHALDATPIIDQEAEAEVRRG